MKKFITLLAIALSVSACDKAENKAKPTEAEGHEIHEHGEHEHAEGGHAPAGYEPGSHEDWCGEHAVPESMCTRCNKSLIAGFKATGDWCDEHELPKSQCLACDPNLKIERPPKKAAP